MSSNPVKPSSGINTAINYNKAYTQSHGEERDRTNSFYKKLSEELQHKANYSQKPEEQSSLPYFKPSQTNFDLPTLIALRGYLQK